jgi:hypothetical protein
MIKWRQDEEEDVSNHFITLRERGTVTSKSKHYIALCGERALAGATHTPRGRLRNEYIYDITHDLLLVTNLGTLAMT